jgi:CheY-like chemotaxis protein
MRIMSRKGPEDAGGCLCVLVIEDNADAAEVMCELIGLFGHRAEVASSGPEGIEAARRLRPDVVLCDIGLPGLDGYAVARELRADPATAGVRLVALTGYSGPAERQRSREAGFDLHLVKPVDPSELRMRLQSWAGTLNLDRI